jgi:hypothetical protein
MKRRTFGLILSAMVLLPAIAAAQPQPLDPARFDAVLAAARACAADRTLIFYCLCYANEMRPFLYGGVQADTEGALVKRRAAGADARAGLVDAAADQVRDGVIATSGALQWKKSSVSQ